MGGAQLMNLQEELPENIKDKVEIKGTVSIPGCEDGTTKKPPFASVNDRIIEEANIEKLIKEIEVELSK